MEAFVRLYGAKHPKACECLTKDRSELLVFYDYPAEHWGHLRTTNPIESTFATVRHRTRQTKGCGSRKATLSMAFKLALSASRRWRRLRGASLLAKVVQRVEFVDGEEKEKMETAA
jgi:putative transposase